MEKLYSFPSTLRTYSADKRQRDAIGARRVVQSKNVNFVATELGRRVSW